MDRRIFEENLVSEGYSEIVTVERVAHGFLDTHAHPFEAKALILAGEIALRVDATERRYQVGDVFHLPANQTHTERYGPSGVSYLVGRK